MGDKRIIKFAFLVSYKDGVEKEEVVVYPIPYCIPLTFDSLLGYLKKLDADIEEMIDFKPFYGYPIWF